MLNVCSMYNIHQPAQLARLHSSLPVPHSQGAQNQHEIKRHASYPSFRDSAHPAPSDSSTVQACMYVCTRARRNQRRILCDLVTYVGERRGQERRGRGVRGDCAMCYGVGSARVMAGCGLWVVALIGRAGGGRRGGLFFGYGDGLGVLDVSGNLLGAERKSGEGEGDGGREYDCGGGGGRKEGCFSGAK